MSKYCWKEKEKESGKKREKRRKRHEDRVRKCRQRHWWDPIGWFCWISVIVSYILEWFWDTFWVWVELLKCVACEIGAILNFHLIIKRDLNRGVHSEPKLTATTFNNADVESRFGYTDSGKRYQFKIIDDVVWYKTNDSAWQIVGTGAVSYTYKRKGVRYTAPKFDMIATDGSRILAKEVGKDNFYFTTMKDEFLHADDPKGKEFGIPGFYVKLDPEYNQPGADYRDLKWWNRKHYDHPAMDPFWFLPLLKGLGLAKDYMMVKVQPRVWHLLDTRPPFWSGDPPDWVMSYAHVTYGGKFFGNCEKREQKSIEIQKVLDIDVGNMHRHIHYEDIHGGEMDNGPDVFVHGPIEDKGGYCDGTCNFYILCKIKIKKTGSWKSAYGILWIDEQSYASERWRLLHPDDSKWSLGRDWALMGGLTGVKNWFWNWFKHYFDRERFWCPFEDSWFGENSRFDDKSRLAVSRQTVVVAGTDRIYSINFSWGTSDRTWRWRKYPCRTKDASNWEKTPDEVACYPQTIGIREDMTIYMKGIDSIDGQYQRGYWYQKYLPADLRCLENLCWVPPDSEESANREPINGYSHAQGYSHEWDFITKENFDRANSFCHFGVYDEVDSRNQYYLIDLAQESDFPENYPEQTQWMDVNSDLFINQLVISVPPLLAEWLGAPPAKYKHRPPSMFNKRTYLKIVRREPLGLIAMHWDKRDDDLIEFTKPLLGLIERKATLTNVTDSPGINDTKTFPPKPLKVTLRERKQDLMPPVVQKAKVSVDKDNEEITISFYSRITDPPPDLPAEPNDNFDVDFLDPDFSDPDFSVDSGFSPDTSIWRVKIGALDSTCEDGVCVVFNEVISDKFERKSRYLYWYKWKPSDFARAAKYCDETECVKYGTSVWFEDIVGHVNTAEKTIFKSIQE